MRTPSDPWHFARPELAGGYLQAFDLGLVSARGLFARRRMGKSEFLKHDLLPAAEAAGYLAAYTNLWDDADHPGQAIATAILSAARPKGLAQFWEDLSTPIRKMKAGGKLPLGVEGSLELDLADKEKLAVPAIQAALQAADKTRKRLILMIDEAQVLAAPEHRQVAHSLRAGLDIRKASVKVLFAGSSEAALREMFSRASAPFYNWAPVEPFPLLGDAFVSATVAQVKRLAKQPLALADARQAFLSLKETPEFFRWYIERYLLYQGQGPELALQHTLARVHDDSGHAKAWKAMNRSDRAVLLLAARGVQDLYGAAALTQLRELMGSGDVTASVPRSALRRLTGPKMQAMARVDHGLYRFEDPEFEAWVRSRRTID
ncbi:hypothetical protein [Variovorax ginsengisoli]|jgi:hypothetical protein|uniref:ATP-binding protein n=1 Tax=Variovorax ginsengisoli TaxID=363844 RepID=A0ABT8RXE0_9BURK|nr:hypothetical protein [Variovorax ginsengisoli]MDN8612157.1 hypothetical protein [Variovorax ginsengisoli]MDO1531327.1 hypothetical protein [Variovorax ginsengisoli]